MEVAEVHSQRPGDPRWLVIYAICSVLKDGRAHAFEDRCHNTPLLILCIFLRHLVIELFKSMAEVLLLVFIIFPYI